MKKNTAKKGFTIVELVIVIAVIAILAAVLIPTFSSVVDKANESAALQKATNALQIVTMVEDGQLSGTYYFTVGDYTFKYVAGAADGALKQLGEKEEIPSTAKEISNTDIANLGVVAKK